jgi:Flp pilus assembly protein TadG
VRCLPQLRHRDPERGTTTVEFALVLPLLILMTIGAYDACRMVVSNTMLAYATTIGARAGIVSSTTSTATVQTAVVNAAPFLNLSTSNVTTVSSSNGTWATRTRGDTVTVTATYTFTPVIPVLTRLIQRTYTYTSKMKIP